jgi:hypothetical protein
MDLDAARALALQLMEQHITAKPPNSLYAGPSPHKCWTFRFDNAKRRFGRCQYTLGQISLSKPLTLLNNEAHVRDTILHEIAHANVGYDAAHGPKWRAEALRLGCDGNTCFDSEKVVAPRSPWMGYCPGCKRKFRRYQRPPASPRSCGRCAPRRYDPRFQLQWARTIITDPEAYALEQQEAQS